MIKEYSPSFEELQIEKTSGLRSDTNIDATQSTMVEVRRQNLTNDMASFLGDQGFIVSSEMNGVRTDLKAFLKTSSQGELDISRLDDFSALDKFFPAYQELAEKQANTGTSLDGILIQVANAELLLDINWFGDSYNNLCSAFTLADNLAQAGNEDMTPVSDTLLEFVKELIFDQPKFQDLYQNIREVQGSTTTKEDVFYDVMETGSYNAEPDDTLDIVLDAGMEVLRSDFLPDDSSDELN